MPTSKLINVRVGSLLLLGLVIGVLAVLFGNAYDSHGHVAEEGEHAEKADTQAEAMEEEEHADEEAGEEEGSRSVKIAGSILISTAGAGLVPLGLLLGLRRRDRLDDLTPISEPGTPMGTPPERSPRTGMEPVLVPALALLSAGAAVIHFVVIPGHWDEYWGQGLFFIVAAIAQLVWAIWVLVDPSRLILLAGAAGNAAIVAMWVITRTAGVPAGPAAGEREAIEFADTLATAFEVVLVLGALALVRMLPTYRPRRSVEAIAASTVLALVVAALTAASLLSLVEV